MSYVSSITVKPAQTTTSTRRPIVSLPKQIPIQSLLYKTTTCLTRSATTCLSHKWKKKKLSKTATAKLYPAEKWEAMNKNKSLSDYIYFVATL